MGLCKHLEEIAKVFFHKIKFRTYIKKTEKQFPRLECFLNILKS